MTSPEVVSCGDGQFRRAIYGLGPYIADYPEQVLLTCVVSGWCPRYFLVIFTRLYTHICHRCTAPANDLDGTGYVFRSHVHTETLVEELELGVLWDEYGLVGDIVVCFPCPQAFSPFTEQQKPFTNDFPRADIHEVIAPDILHQLIKGVFKDHLVTWVEEYLVQTHGRARANIILDDIDNRYCFLFSAD